MISSHYKDIFTRVNVTYKKLVVASKDAKVERALRRFLDAIRNGASGEKEYIELDGKISKGE